MYVYSMLTHGINTKLEQRLGIAVKSELEGFPSVSIIVRKSISGGVSNPVEHITDPSKTVVIAGTNNDAGMDFAIAASEAGVPEENIFFSPISARDLIVKIKEILPSENPGLSRPLQDTQLSQERVKTIAVVGFRGGVGKSTIAASLADHYRGNGEVVAIVDLGSPPVVYRHFGFKELDGETVNDFIVLKGEVDIFVPKVSVYDFPGEALVKTVDRLKKEYRRVIIDYSSEPKQGHLDDISIDCLVVVVDHDMVLSVKGGIEGICVYNKAVPEVPAEVVTDIIRNEPVVIKMDIECCIAALVSGETAYRSSGAIAEGIGNLAFKIG